MTVGEMRQALRDFPPDAKVVDKEGREIVSLEGSDENGDIPPREESGKVVTVKQVAG